MTEDDDAPLYPLIGFTIGLVDGAVAVRFEYASSRAEWQSRAGESQQYVMTPENAVEIGRALVQTGELAQMPPGPKPS